MLMKLTLAFKQCDKIMVFYSTENTDLGNQGWQLVSQAIYYICVSQH